MAGIFDKYEQNRNTEQRATEQAITNQKPDVDETNQKPDVDETNQKPDVDETNQKPNVEDTTTVKVMFSMTNAQKIKLKQKALEQGKTASALVQEFIDSLK